jgi:predicted ATPase/class 3 adenylate cyclase
VARGDLPTGTVTFLFTDVEGSTRLLDEVGEARYAHALAEHRRLIREAIDRHRGVEVDTQGDAFFCAFPDAGEAAAAASEALAALEDGPIRVRMGLHTGDPIVTDEGYVGREIHRGARIAAAGHGGQVLLSRATRELVEAEATDLGEHRLKDFAEPVWIFQLGTERFPPIRTISNTNLPRPASSFIGREREVAEVVALLRDGNRLLTLSGPGGSGKTRLAIEAASELVPSFANGVFWVELAPVRDPDLVESTIAGSMGAEAGLAEHVGERAVLLLLDNFEQVVDAAPALPRLLEACPNLGLLVTSRELLRVRGEVEYPVPPLAEDEAVELFSARANLDADATVAELCRRLDDLPLAVELAARRANVLSPAQILERLGARLDLLQGGRDAEARQRTLRTTIEWSHDLLSAVEQALFARMAVFTGGASLEAAEAVCDADLDVLGSLVDKSLVRHERERFWMLETIRQFATERLEASGEAEDIRRRHVEFFLGLAESANLTTEALETGAGQRQELVLLEEDNLRAALDQATRSDPVLGLRLAVALEQFWVTRHVEGTRRFETLMPLAGGAPPELLARGFRVFGGACDIGGDVDRAEQQYERSLALYERLGDEWGQVHLLHRLGVVALLRDDVEGVRRRAEECLARARAGGFRLLQAEALGNLAWVEERDGNLEAAFELLLQDLAISREIGFTWFEANDLDGLADLSLRLGRTDDAEVHALEALELGERMDDRLVVLMSLALLALVSRARGETERAGRLLGAVEVEAADTPLGRGQQDLDERVARALVDRNAELEHAMEAGRRLSIGQAVEEARAARRDVETAAVEPRDRGAERAGI